MEYQEISIDGIEICHLQDQGSFLFVAKSSRSFSDLSSAITVFRKAYVSAITDEVKPLCEKTQYETFINEMESFPTKENINNNEYNKALEMKGTETPTWLNDLYNNHNYLEHISFQDKLHEGVYESVTQFKDYYLYWCYG